MKEFTKLLVALSLAKDSKDKFNFTAKLALKLDADIIAVNIINSRDVEAVGKIMSMGYEIDGEHFIENVKKERKELMETIIRESGFPMDRVQMIIKVGNPADEILKLIEQEKVGMVIMGPRGRTDIEHLIVGSVAEKVFRRSPVTVISYRDEKHIERLKRHL